MLDRDKITEHLRTEVVEVDAKDAQALLISKAAQVIDIREADENEVSAPAGAIWVSKSFLEIDIFKHVQSFNETIILMCQSGSRSLHAALALTKMGFSDVKSLKGGFASWSNYQLPTTASEHLSVSAKKRYSRQIMLPEIGEKGQTKLSQSTVTVVGMGGLGCPAALYLAAAGVGTICIVDNDDVSISNLHRQILYSESDCGLPKVSQAARRIAEQNPSCEVRPFKMRLIEKTARNLLCGSDIILDCSDNIDTRFLLNRIAHELRLPLVQGSVFGFDGQISIFFSGGDSNHSPCYACTYPEPPPPGFAPSCGESGVLGATAGIVGVIQAAEALKLLLGYGNPIIGKTLFFDGMKMKFNLFSQHKDADCEICGVMK